MAPLKLWLVIGFLATANCCLLQAEAANISVASLVNAAQESSPKVTNLDASFTPAADNWVTAFAVQGDTKILVGGAFTSIAGQNRSRIARLNRDGTVDSAFNPNANSDIHAISIQSDGKILVGGKFTAIAGQTKRALARLNSDGSLDGTFVRAENPNVSTEVSAVLVQPDGKIIMAGQSTVNGVTGGFVTRLDPYGAFEQAFSTAYGGVNGPVSTITLQPDGKLLIGGLFTRVGTQVRNRIARLNPDGTLDAQFDPNVDAGVLCMAVQGDGRIIVGGGNFTKIGGHSRTNLARLEADGTVDTDFEAHALGSFPNGAVIYSCALQSDGKIIVGGSFSSLGGASRGNIGRLNPNGTVDETFVIGASSTVYGVTLQPDGKVLVGGMFGSVSSASRGRLARLDASEPAIDVFGYEGSTLMWRRRGAAPEIRQAFFEVSANGSSWTSLGTGTRVENGWALGNAFFSPGAVLRARGYVTGGSRDGSAWLVERIFDPSVPPSIVTGTGSLGISSNHLGFAISAAYNQTVIVEISQDMSTWTSVSTNQISDSPGYFSDPHPANETKRFYRLRLP